MLGKGLILVIFDFCILKLEDEINEFIVVSLYLGVIK